MKDFTRRDFVKSSIAAGFAAALPFSRVRGANDRICVGVVGLGGRGTGAHVPSFEKQEGVTVVALSDADRERMAAAAKVIESKYGHKAEQYVDMRKMFERKDIDVVGNATQNYWHGLSTIRACQAGVMERKRIRGALNYNMYFSEDHEYTTKSGKRIWPHITIKHNRKGKALGRVQRVFKRKKKA